MKSSVVALLIAVLVAPAAFAAGKNTRHNPDEEPKTASDRAARETAKAFKINPNQPGLNKPNGCQTACAEEFDACADKCGPVPETKPGSRDGHDHDDDDSAKKKPGKKGPEPSKVDTCTAQCAKTVGTCYARCK